MAMSERQLETIFIATPPSTPLSLTRTTTPRDLPTMYHFDFAPTITEFESVEQQREDKAPDALGLVPTSMALAVSAPLAEQSSSSDLTPCPNCSRTFNLNALRKHVTICEKMSKKRKVFDSSRQRRVGTTLETHVLPKNFGLPNAEKVAGVLMPTAVMRSTMESSVQPLVTQKQNIVSPVLVQRKIQPPSELVRSTVRSSLRKAATSSAETAMPVAVTASAPASTPPGMTRERMRSSDRSLAKRIKDVACEHCPHCKRNFNVKAFDRHVEWCKEKAIQATIKVSTTNENNKAKERLEARIQYRPPNLKTKRSINRDKYSNTADEPQELTEKQSQAALASLTLSVHSDKPILKAATTGTAAAMKLSSVAKSNMQITGNRVPNGRHIHQNARQKQHDICNEIDEVMQRCTANAIGKEYQLAEHLHVKVPQLQQKKRQNSNASGGHSSKCGNNNSNSNNNNKNNSNKSSSARKKFKERNCSPLPRVASFDSLTDIITYKGASDMGISKKKVDKQHSIKPKSQSATSQNKAYQQKHNYDQSYSKMDRENLQLLGSPQKEWHSRRHCNNHKDNRGVPNNDVVDLSQYSAFIASQRSYERQFKHTKYYESDESESPCAKMQVKLKASKTKHCFSRPPKRQMPSPAASGAMRAIPLPQLKQELNMLGRELDASKRVLMKISKNATDDHDIESDSELSDTEPDVDNNATDANYDLEPSNAKLRELDSSDDCDDEHLYSDSESESEQEVQEVQMLKKKGSKKNKIHMIMLEQDENGLMYLKSPVQSKGRGRSSPTHGRNKSGLIISDKYDPFLSAKRQLEELCSPNSMHDDDILPITLPNTPTPTTIAKTPAVTIPSSMSTSLTTPQTHYNSGSKPLATSTPVTSSSHFRRTSSLRGPRRTPLLPSRPLYVTNYRPTIQRGLSDEGPISTNFLKPEEYDEMPVRAACGNDFHSPRVTRRDTSASNRKQQQKQQLPSNGAESNGPSHSVVKTDSLAVFLKYEHELEQLNAKAADAAANQLSSKELKDKSNNLSKQNSAKNIRLESLTTNTASSQLPMLTAPSTPLKENNENVAHNFGNPFRLEPIGSKPFTSLVKPTTPQQLPLLPTSPYQQPQQVFPSNIRLNSIFEPSQRERKLSNGSDYIDPKLINPCDNLNMQLNSCASDESSTQSSNESTALVGQRAKLIQQPISLSQSSSQSTITQVCIEKRNSAEGRNLLKRKMRLGRNQFLYDASPEEADCSSCCSADDEANRSSMEYDEQCWNNRQQQNKNQNNNNNNVMSQFPHLPHMPTFDDFDFEEFLSSFENDDDEQFPLFRDCREFLLNRTASRQRSLSKVNSAPNNQNPQQQQHYKHINTNNNTPRPATTGQRLSTRSSPMQPLFNTPIKSISYNTHRSGSSACSKSTPIKTIYDSGNFKLKREPSSYSNSSKEGKVSPVSSESKLADQKREIFISIETEPNAMGDSPISPDTLRQMVGNEQTPIEMVEIKDGHEPEHAKFRKISDTDDVNAGITDVETDEVAQLTPSAITAEEPLTLPAPKEFQTDLELQLNSTPNVQFNNAKNLIQQMQSDFRQLGEDASTSMRKALLLQITPAPPPPPPPQQHGDSDEFSSLDGYPILCSSQSSRQGPSGKLSSDSAYGSSNSPHSLSRQRSSEFSTPRSQSNILSTVATQQTHPQRPHTASGTVGSSNSNNIDKTPSIMQETPSLAHQLLFGGDVNSDSSSNSSCSDNALPVVAQQEQQPLLLPSPQTAANSQQHYQLQSTTYNDNSNNNNNSSNNSNINSPATSQHSLISQGSNTSMTASMKMSKFCHECGFKFIIDQAKFCMECGVKRLSVN